MNKVDLLFIVDVTGSMGGFISEAKRRMQDILETLSEKHKVDLQVALSFYRDHPSQESTFVTAVYDLDNFEKASATIKQVSVNGGGDFPEAVLDGIVDGIKDQKWREGSRRIAFLIGDAPAHGMYDNENCCMCGLTWGDAVRTAQDNKVTIYSIVLGDNSDAVSTFKTIANFTGGILINTSGSAMDIILETLAEEFDSLNLSTKIISMLSQKHSQEEICKMLGIDRDKFSASMSKAYSIV